LKFSLTGAAFPASVALCRFPHDFLFAFNGLHWLGLILFMEEHIEVEGRIQTVLAGTMFRVELDNKHQVLATISGKMRKRFVRLTVGDRVKMEMSQYDLNKARIVWRIG
jgi:translation initiation factor IF-1